MMVGALLLFASALGTGALLRLQWLNPMIISSGSVLLVEILLYLGALLLLLGSWSKRPPLRSLFWVTIGIFALIHGTLLFRQFDFRFPFNAEARVHDGAVQVEEAARFVIHGTNPYTADFQSTRFGMFQNVLGPEYENIAWTHLVYPPATVFMAVPVVWLQNAGVKFDLSAVYLLCLWALAWLLIKQVGGWENRLRIAILTLGNPLIWFLPLAGFNDTPFVLAVVTGIVLTRHSPRLAGLSLGLAVALKQTVWPVAALWLLWIWSQKSFTTTKKQMTRWFVCTAAVLYGPFLLWSFGGLWDDLIRYPSGVIPNSFPISGSTVAQYLHVWGIVPSAWSSFPIWIFQAIVAGTIGWFGFRKLKDTTDPSTFLLVGMSLMLGIMLVSRFVFENYLQAVFLLGISAYALQFVGKTPSDTSVKS